MGVARRSDGASPIAVAPPVARVEVEPTDAELVAAALRGEHSAEEALFRRHARDVTRTVIHLLGDSTEAEDVVQDSFVAVLRDLGRLREPAAFRSWLLRVAVNKVHRRFRRRKLRRALGLERGDQDASLAELVDRRESPEVAGELALLWNALERLPAKLRTAWTLRHVEGFSHEEIAEVAGCSLASVKRYLASAETKIERRVRDG